MYEATHTHPTNMCPLLTAEGKTAIKQLFSDQNIRKAGIKLDAAYFSCPKDTAADHKAFFTIEASDPAAITKFFGNMAVEVRPVVTLSELAKSL